MTPEEAWYAICVDWELYEVGKRSDADMIAHIRAAMQAAYEDAARIAIHFSEGKERDDYDTHSASQAISHEIYQRAKEVTQ